MTQKVAYQVDREDGEGSVVVFDTHGLAARRKGACMLDIGGEDEYCTVRRVKEFDQYAEKGFVPAKALLEAGWWIPSAHDYDILESDTDDFNSENFVFSLDEKCVWKDWDEMERHAYFINEALDRKTWFENTVKAAYPQFTFTEFWGGPHHITHVAYFEFPGSRYKGTIYWDWEEDKEPSAQDFRCYVCQGDQEALDNYLKSLV